MTWTQRAALGVPAAMFGKTTVHTDTYHSRFIELAPRERRASNFAVRDGVPATPLARGRKQFSPSIVTISNVHQQPER